MRKRLLLTVALGFIFLFYAISSSRSPPIYPPDKDVFTKTCPNTATVSEISAKMKEGLPVIYFITPTFSRREQVAELTRLSQTLLNVPNLVWVIAEDAKDCSQVVTDVLDRHRDRIPSAHLVSPIPKMYLKEYYKPRGVSSRNAAMKWVLDNDMHPEGVIYFADDDNTYDLRLFDEIRWTKKVSMFPVGFIGGQGISGPIVKDGKVIGFTDNWFENRHFPVDMAGFATHTSMARRANGRMPYRAGHEEDLFLRNLGLNYSDIEPKANLCTEVLVWHTKTVKVDIPEVRMAAIENELEGTSLQSLIKDMVSKGLVKMSKSGKVIPICLKPEGCKT
jgi:beta-1,3-glucuronyltransferase